MENLLSINGIYNFLLNEGVEAKITWSELKKMVEPFGWELVPKKSDKFIIKKNGYRPIGGHLEHGNSSWENRRIDVNTLDTLRDQIIQDYQKSGDLTLIKQIPWSEWQLPNPLNRELVNIDPETGAERVVPETIGVGQRLAQARKNKAIQKANELLKDATVWKLDETKPDSVCIIAKPNKFGNLEYNTCRSFEDRRPILKEWTSSMKKEGSKIYFGYVNGRTYEVDYKRVLEDGQLNKTTEFSLDESKNVSFAKILAEKFGHVKNFA